jgi:rhodanese-related sulfurtransferase
MKKIYALLTVSFLIIFSVSGQNTNQTDTLYANITVQQADTLIQAHVADTNFIILDVRTPSEYSGGFIEDAININYYAVNFGALIDTLNRDKIYLVYCGSGNRSAKARDTMITKHFVTIYNMLGGTSAWVGAGYTLNMPTQLTELLSENLTQIFPNPVTENSVLDISSIWEPGLVVEIFDAQGRITDHIAVTIDKQVMISKDQYGQGLYFFCVISDTSILAQGKFIIEK